MYRVLALLITSALLTSGCATSGEGKCVSAEDANLAQAEAKASAASAEAAKHETVAEAPTAPPQGYVFPLSAAESDQPITPKVVHEDAHVKIALVRIKPGATMPEHAAQVPTTVQTLSGAGEMTISGEPHALKVGEIFYMDAGAPHALNATGDASLVVLVHYLKGGAKIEHHAH